MSLVSKLEADLELKTSALKFLEVFSTRTPELAIISPHIIQSLEVLSGELGTPGFVIFLHYTVDGKPSVAKDVVEDINLTDISITFKVIEGDLVEQYKSFKFIIKLIPHLLEGSVVHWTMEYEKRNEQDPDPSSLMEVVLQLSKDIDAYVGKLL